MNDYLYLIINLASISIPFIYSFERKMNFIRWWKPVFLSIILVGSLFIFWDILFTNDGVWGFNSKYHLDINVLGIPFEEALFFVCIPYASLFTHYAFIYFFEHVKLSDKTVHILSTVFFIVVAYLFIKGFSKVYTSVNFALFLVLLLYSKFVKKNHLSRFFITFAIILIPFFIVNGILTGSFIEDEVVWYNSDEFMGIRIFTIPFEDIIYAFNLLYLNLIVIEKLKPYFNRQLVKA